MPTSFWKKNKWVIAVSVSVVTLFFCWLIRPKEESDKVSYTGLTPNSLDKIKPKRKPCLKKNENECKRILEDIFKKTFISIRPNWLKYPKTKRNLELDLYNEELNLACEYDGKQHSIYLPHFHRKYDDFVNQVDRDNWKTEKCKELKINLIRVPHTVKFKDLETYIRAELIKINMLPN